MDLKEFEYICDFIKCNYVKIPRHDNISISLCTVDGRIFTVGNVIQPFPIRSCINPFLYCYSRTIQNPCIVHSRLGYDNSNTDFFYNPMTINGSLILTHLTNTYEQSHIRFGRFLNVLNHTLRYDDTLTLDTLDYNNQSECGDNFISSAYELLGHGSFGKPKPPKQVFERSVDLFFKNRSIEIDTNKASVMSCILANKGINPFTDEQVFNDHIVSDCVKLLHLHGMNDYSGQFGFEVGLPAKTSDSGLTMLVAPGKFGLCVRSTLLDINNNSEYGIHFCRNLCNMEEYCYRNIYRF